MGNGSGVSRGDRNRNARLARVRALVPAVNAIVGIDLADKKHGRSMFSGSLCVPRRPRFGRDRRAPRPRQNHLAHYSGQRVVPDQTSVASSWGFTRRAGETIKRSGWARSFRRTSAMAAAGPRAATRSNKRGHDQPKRSTGGRCRPCKEAIGPLRPAELCR
jgi:hypothetical protein